MRDYRPRAMPARFYAGAPEIVRKGVLDIFKIAPAAPLEFDIVLKPESPITDMSSAEIAGLDFGANGAQGCHFCLKPHEMRDYRERNRRKRVAWADLPAPTQAAIIRYLVS